jgi:hypothetical protein
MNIQFVKKSSNKKIGDIPCTTSSRKTCPSACPLSGKGGCYAEAGYYTRLNWNKVDSGERGNSFESLLESVRKLPDGQLWRHNVAGDLVPAEDNVIDVKALEQLTEANHGRKGFTYTHYPILNPANMLAVKRANESGFTVNVSTNSIDEARELESANLGLPIVTIVPNENFWEDSNRVGDIVRCPAEISDKVTCKSCGLCANANRSTIVGFTPHGSRKSAAQKIAVRNFNEVAI